MFFTTPTVPHPVGGMAPYPVRHLSARRIQDDFGAGHVVVDAPSVLGKDERVVDDDVRRNEGQEPIDKVSQDNVLEHGTLDARILVDDSNPD